MKKSRLIGASCAVAFSFISMSSHAATITDFVTVDGNDWAQVNLFTNLSWNQMNAQCPAGVCGTGSILNGLDMDGWSWASATEVGDLLFSSLSSHPGGIANYVEIHSTWAPEVFGTLGFLPTRSTEFELIMDGLSSDPRGNPDGTGIGFAPLIADRIGTIDLTVNDLAYTSQTRTEGVDGGPNSGLGGWYYRESAVSAVPVPAAAWLFGSGLLGLVGMARRKKA